MSKFKKGHGRKRIREHHDVRWIEERKTEQAINMLCGPSINLYIKGGDKGGRNE